MKKLLALSNFLIQNGLKKEALFLRNIIKEAGIKDEALDILKNKFPRENEGMLRSISNNLYKKFSEGGSENILQDIADTIRSRETAQDVIEFLKSDKSPTDVLKSKYPENKEAIDKLKEESIPTIDMPWILKILNNEEKDPLSEIIDTAKYIYNKKSQGKLDKDFSLQNYNTLSDLRDFIDEKFAGNKDLYIARAKSHATSDDGIVKLYESDNFLVVHPKSTKSSIYWSEGTNWCTGRIEGNMFSFYNNKDGMLVYIITKNKDLLEESIKGKNNLSKMSVGFVLNEDKTDAAIEDTGTMTVERNNRSIKKEDIANYLGEEFNDIVNSSKKFIIENQGSWIEKEYGNTISKIVENERNDANLELGIEDFISNNNFKNITEVFKKPSFFSDMIKNEKEKFPEEDNEASFKIIRKFLKDSSEDSSFDYYDISGLISEMSKDKENLQKIINIIFEEEIYKKFDEEGIGEFLEILSDYPVSIDKSGEEKFIIYITENNYTIEDIAQSLKYYNTLRYSEYEAFGIALIESDITEENIISEVSEGINGLSKSAARFLDDYISENVLTSDQTIKSFFDNTKEYRSKNHMNVQGFLDSFYDYKKTFKKLDDFLEKYPEEMGEVTYEEDYNDPY